MTMSVSLCYWAGSYRCDSFKSGEFIVRNWHFLFRLLLRSLAKINHPYIREERLALSSLFRRCEGKMRTTSRAPDEPKNARRREVKRDCQRNLEARLAITWQIGATVSRIRTDKN